MCYFFFFKQKTAYDMRISDWSSDVCSSDLHFRDRHEIARIDLRFIFLGAARPHGALHPGLALQGRERFLHRLVGRQLAHADALGLVGGNAERHPLLLERSEEHTSELQSLMRISYAVFCLKKKKTTHNNIHNNHKR